MAQVQRKNIESSVVHTAMPDEVGRWIVDAIFDDTGPQRYGSDDSSQATLERWRTTADEVIAGEVLSGYSSLLPRTP